MREKENTFFYGWWIVGATFITMFIGLGTTFYSFGVFFKYLLGEFGWSRTQLSLAKSLWSWMSGLSGPIMGSWIDKYGARRVMILGSIVLGFSLFLLSRIRSPGQFYLFYMISGFGFAAVTVLPSTVVLSLWFRKRRSMAIAIATVGLSMAGVVMPNLTNYLIFNFGWRMAYAAMGVMAFAIALPLVILVIRSKPEEMGLLPDGEKTIKNEGIFKGLEPAPAPSPKGMRAVEAMKTLSFWILAVIFLLAHAAMTAVLIHLVPFLTDHGLSSAKAAFALSLVPIMGIVSRVGWGYLGDRFSPRYVLMFCYLFMAVGLLVLQGTAITGIPYLYAILFGFGVGGKTAIEALVVPECFGMASFGTIFGYLRISQIGAGGLGPLFAGYIFDLTQNYYLAFTSFIIGFIVAAAGLLFTRPFQEKKKPMISF